MLLRKAHEAAQELRRTPWEFAVEIGELHAAGLSNTDLRYLLCEGYVVHAVEQIRLAPGCRSFQKLANLALPKRSCFIITVKGLHSAGRRLDQLAPVRTARQPAPKNNSTALGNHPTWDGVLNQLRWKGQIVKHFRLPAANQQAILAAFEEEGWPLVVDDPLPPVAGLDPKTRLHDTIKSLNRNQVNRLLCFWGDGKGLGIGWNPVIRSESSPELPWVDP
jgi:hypothetical protein